MSSYILRRRMWHQCLVDMSSEMRLPDAVLAEQLLLSANLGHDHQLMIRTAVQGELAYDGVADQLLAQHGKLHERASRRTNHHGASHPRDRHRGGGNNNYYKKYVSKQWSRTGYAAYDQDYIENDDEDNGYNDGDTDYPPEEMDIMEQQIGYYVEEGVDLEDPDEAEYTADILQAEAEAFYAKKGAASSKGGGFRPPSQRQFQVSGSLSLEERRQKIASLKSRTTCRRCGQTGHWSGDSVCPATKGQGKKGKPRPGSGSGTSHTPPSNPKGGEKSGGGKQRTVYFSIREDGNFQPTAHLAYRTPQGRGFHAVPPPSNVNEAREESPRGSEWSIVPGEQRAHWQDIAPATDRELPVPGRPLTQNDLEEIMLQHALGRVNMDVDEEPHDALPVPAQPLFLADRYAHEELTAWRTQGPQPNRSPEARGSPGLQPQEVVSPEPCNHERTTTKGSNAHFRQVRCLDCGVLLERKKMEGSTPTRSAPANEGDLCSHHRVSWKGTNGNCWRTTCLDCGMVRTGTVTSRRSDTLPERSMATGNTSMLATSGSERESVRLTKTEALHVVDSFSTAVHQRLSEVSEDTWVETKVLVEALVMGALFTANMGAAIAPRDSSSSTTRIGTSSTPGSSLPQQPPGRQSQSDVLWFQTAQEIGRWRVSEGKYKNQIAYNAYQDVSYRDWVINSRSINEKSSKGMKQLKLKLIEIQRWEGLHGLLFTDAELGREHRAIMALHDEEDDAPAGNEGDLVAVLDTGCNTTCHAEIAGFKSTSW